MIGIFHFPLITFSVSFTASTREKADTELGPTMQAMADRYLGIELDYIDYIEHDDAVWLTVR